MAWHRPPSLDEIQVLGDESDAPVEIVAWHRPPVPIEPVICVVQEGEPICEHRPSSTSTRSERRHSSNAASQFPPANNQVESLNQKIKSSTERPQSHSSCIWSFAFRKRFLCTSYPSEIFTQGMTTVHALNNDDQSCPWIWQTLHRTREWLASGLQQQAGRHSHTVAVLERRKASCDNGCYWCN